MRRTLSEIVTEIRVEGAEAARRAFNNVGNAAGSLKTVLGTVVKGVAGVFAAIAGGAAIFATAILKTINYTTELKKMADQAGLTVERLQSLTYAARQYGVDQDRLSDGLKTLKEALGDFRVTGAGPAVEAIKDLGLETALLSGDLNTTGAAFDAIVMQLAQVPSEFDRAAYAAQLFGGDVGVDMVKFLSAGGKAIDILEVKAQDLGLVLSNETVAGAVDAGRELATLAEVIKVQFYGAIAGVIPQLTEMVKRLTTGASGEKFVKDVQTIALALAKAAGAALTFTRALVEMFTTTHAERLNELQAEQNDLLEHRIRLSEALASNPTNPKIIAGMETIKERLNAVNDEMLALQLSTGELNNSEINVKVNTEGFGGVSVGGTLKDAIMDQADALTPILNEIRQTEINMIDDIIEKRNEQMHHDVALEEQKLQQYKDGTIERIKAEELFAIRKVEIEKAAHEEIKQLTDERTKLEVEGRARVLDAYRQYYDSRNAGEAENSKESEKVSELRNNLEGLYETSVRGFAEMAASGETNFGSLKDSIIKSIGEMIIQQLVFNAIAGLTSGAKSLFGSGSVSSVPTPNANGGVFYGKQSYNSNNTMSEQGAEAVMPLARDSQGRLAVRSSGGGGSSGPSVGTINVTVNGGGNDSQETRRQAELGTKKALENLIDARMVSSSRTGGILRPTRTAGAF